MTNCRCVMPSRCVFGMEWADMRVAVVGTGSIGRRHIANLGARGDCEVMAVSEHSRREHVYPDGTSLRTCHRYEEALSWADAVFICNPTALHQQYLEAAIEADRHVYIEKPVAISTAGLAAILAEADRRRRVVTVGTQFRFNHMLLHIRDFLQRGMLGQVLNVYAWSGEHIADYHPKEDYRQSYAARSDLGGGVLLTQIHQLDYLNWLFGPFDNVTAFEVSVPTLGIDVEASVSYQLSGRRDIPVAGHLNYLQRPKCTGMQITGTGGRIEWSYENNSVVFTQADRSSPQVMTESFDRNQMFVDIVDDFLTSIRTGANTRAPLGDGIEALRLVEAIKNGISARTRRAEPESGNI